jgi:hypothetical protein
MRATSFVRSTRTADVLDTPLDEGATSPDTPAAAPTANAPAAASNPNAPAAASPPNALAAPNLNALAAPNLNALAAPNPNAAPVELAPVELAPVELAPVDPAPAPAAPAPLEPGPVRSPPRPSSPSIPSIPGATWHPPARGQPSFAHRARALMRVRAKPADAAATFTQAAGDALASVVSFSVSALLLTFLLAELYVRYAHVYLKQLAPNGSPQGSLMSLEVLVACSPVVAVCALPTLISYSLVAAGQRMLETRLAFDVPGGPSSPREAEWAPAFVEARLRWRHEASHVLIARKRIAEHGRLYGLLLSLLLGLCAMVATRQVLFGERPETQPAKVSLAIATALLITYARDLGRMAIRVANRDASSRMIAWNIKRLLMTAAGTLLLSGFAFAGSLPEALQGPAGWLLIGGGMALFADQVMEAVGDRFAAVFGIKRPPPVETDSLRRLDGMGEDDLERLGEEGVDSIHALAMCSTATLFFNTPYALHRICDWQDQALLVVLLGETKARLFREHLQLRGGIDAQRFALDFLRGERVGAKEREDLVKMLGFASESQAHMVLERLGCNDMIRQLACFRKALPVDVGAHDAPEPTAR